ncbi:hypothetical protein HY488_02170 [Candidatus Woesearchaeota archaeon]|nr:hypothetical protein [Candidatus Woesearchaeota archaeon]
MSGTKELFWQHGKVLVILLIFSAVAITLLGNGKLLKMESNKSNAISSLMPITINTIREDLPQDSSMLLSFPVLMKNLFYLLVLVSLLLAGYHTKLAFVGRMPTSEDERKLAVYIVLAREHGFSDADIMERLIMAGWDYTSAEKATNNQQFSTEPQRKL